MNNTFKNKQLIAYQALTRSLIVRLWRISLLLFQSLLHMSLELWLYSTILPDVRYAIPGLLWGLLANEMVSETSFNLYFAKFKGHLYAILASPMSDYAILMSYISSGLIRGTTVLTLTLLISHIMMGGITILYPLQFTLLLLLTAIFFSLIGLLEGIYGRSFMQSGFISRLVLSILSTFSGALGPIPRTSVVAYQLMQYNPLYYMNNMVRYYMLGPTSNGFVPQVFLLPQIALLNLVLFVVVMQCFKSLRK